LRCSSSWNRAVSRCIWSTPATSRTSRGASADVLDCQWLQQLMSFGLLAGAFRPQGDLCALRTVARQREMLLSYQARHIQHMQKALTQMNMQLAQVISDVAGETGQNIIRAILAGQPRWAGAGEAQERKNSGQRRTDRQGLARQLAGRAPVHPQAGGGVVRCLCCAVGRMRPAVGKNAGRPGATRG
jgi:hypothetical protein